LYAVGAIGYFLLTGKPLFELKNLRDVLMHQVNKMPPKPSERLGKPIGSDLEKLIMQCLSKEPDERPPNASSLEAALANCQAACTWTRKEAEAWWNQHVSPSPEDSPGSAGGETQAFANVIISR
jgi:serine/threonine protein kinase